MRKLTDWLATLPSTNARIAVTLVVVFGTAVRYWASSSWVPNDSWLMFLAAMSSVDGAVFYAKRKTQHSGANGTAGRETTSIPAQP